MKKVRKKRKKEQVQEYLRKIYKYSSEKGGYIIELALDNYTDVFNEWDPAPYKKRDLDPAVSSYIMECSGEIPVKYPVTLSFQLPREKKELNKEKIVKEGLKTYFSFNLYLIEKDIKKINRRTVNYIVIAFIFLAVVIFNEKIFMENVFLNIFMEGLFIGGWVFLWEAFNLFFFQKLEMNRSYREYKRLYHSPIIFRYD